VEPERIGPSGGEPGHRQAYLARLRRAFFKKSADLKPHRSRYWLTPKPDPEFDAKCTDICTVCQAAPAAAEQDVHTVSIDEMAGIQALKRATPSLPMKPGYVERRELEYVGHGTQCLILWVDTPLRDNCRCDEGTASHRPAASGASGRNHRAGIANVRRNNRSARGQVAEAMTQRHDAGKGSSMVDLLAGR
jgi:hypothetical protein